MPFRRQIKLQININDKFNKKIVCYKGQISDIMKWVPDTSNIWEILLCDPLK